MATIRRQSRRRIDTRDSIQSAWDAGQPPPPEAADPDRRDDVLGCIFFRWADVRPAWGKGHHPHLRDWLEALRTLA